MTAPTPDEQTAEAIRLTAITTVSDLLRDLNEED